MAANPKLLSFLFILFSLAPPLTMAETQYSVTSYGANSDGNSDSSKAFLAAWSEACGSTGPATMFVPKGSFLLEKTVSFEGPCKSSAIMVRIDGTLLAPSDYNVIGSSDNWIIFRHVSGLTISGGTIDGRGAGLWSCKSSGHGCPDGATSLEFSNSDNILIDGLASLNSQKFHIVIHECNNVKAVGVKVSADGDSPNTDGIHVSSSTGVTILNSRIGTGDDCVSVGPGTSKLSIENVACGPGHGISIGSLGQDANEDGVEDVTVKSCTFSGTQNGVRIKTWGRPSSGFVKNVVYQHLAMNNVENPILIDQNYCPGDNNCPGQDSGIKISDVTYQDIRGSSATEVAVKLDCSKANPCTGISMENVQLMYKEKPAEASCVNAGGTSSDVAQSTSCNL